MEKGELDEFQSSLHDKRSEIAFSELDDIDLEEFWGRPDQEVENHLRGLAERASIGQLRQALGIPIHADDVDRQLLVVRFVEAKMGVVRRLAKIAAEFGSPG
jgi:hypothetical protein